MASVGPSIDFLWVAASALGATPAEVVTPGFFRYRGPLPPNLRN